MERITARKRQETEAALFAQILENGQGRLPREVARYLLQLGFSTKDRVRMRELAAKARAGTLTPKEREETRKYERTGNLLGVLQSKARKTLKTSSNKTLSKDSQR